MIEFKNAVPNPGCLGMDKPKHVGKPWKDSENVTTITSPKKTGKVEGNKSTQRREERKPSEASNGASPKKPKPKPRSEKSSEIQNLTVIKSPTKDKEVDEEATATNINNNNPPNQNDDGCPLTGDPVCDKEILSFIRKRQAVFRKISEAGRPVPNVSQPASRSNSIENGNQLSNSQTEDPL